MNRTVVIESQWDGTRLNPQDCVSVSISIDFDAPECVGEPCFVVSVDAPFYADPKPHASASICHHLPHESTHQTDGKGCLNFDGLWNFEVVELFIKGKADKYLELEMGPHGHYLVLACEGYRQCFRRGIEPVAYSASIADSRWIGRLVCPLHFLPPATDVPNAPFSFNAYAIHNQQPGQPKQGDGRVYCSSFPPESASGPYQVADFHKLELFHPLLLNVDQSHASSSLWSDRAIPL
jgi:hypothetical protein